MELLWETGIAETVDKRRSHCSATREIVVHFSGGVIGKFSFMDRGVCRDVYEG